MELTNFSLVASTLVITVGATLQASTGLGAGLMVVPLLALINFELVPGPVIFASLILSAQMALFGRHHIDYRRLTHLFFGLMGGMFLAGFTLSLLSNHWLGIVFSLLIFFAVFISAVGFKVEFSAINVIIAGILSGFMGTTVAIGAPVLALLYQHHDRRSIVSTLGFVYLISSIIMLIMLHYSGHFEWSHMVLGVSLVPGFIVGYLLSRTLAKFLDRGYARLAILAISAVSALILFTKSIIALN